MIGILAIIGLLSSCRIEQVESDPARAANPLSASAMLTRVTPHVPEPQALPVALAAVGLTQGELERTQTALCAALKAGTTPAAALEDALRRIECAARADGAAYTDALVMDSHQARWGAVSRAPDAYLAIDAALSAQRDGAGLRYGVEPLQELSSCPRVSSRGGVESDPAASADLAQRALEPSAHANDALDDDAGVAVSAAPQQQASPEGSPGEAPQQAAAQGERSPDPGRKTPQVLALLMRGPDGSYVAGLLWQGPRLLELASGLAGPVGVQVMPGQLLQVQPDGAVLAEHTPTHDLARTPATAALAYALLHEQHERREQRPLPQEVLIAISDEQAEPIARFGALAHTFAADECGAQQRGPR
jgi:hypothetical protein